MEEMMGPKNDDNVFAARLKRAVENQGDSPYLEARIRHSIKEYESRRGWAWGGRLAPVAAALVVCLGLWIAYNLGHLRFTTAAQEAYIQSISQQIAGIMRVGLGDHVHCTVFRKFPRQPPTAGEMLEQLGPEYGGLLKVVETRVPAEYRIVMAHRCSFHGRRFVHLALKSHSALVSLVITRKRDGESLGGVSIYEASVQRFAIAAFETSDHLAYLVSDLKPAQNQTMAAELAVPVRNLLARLET